jgi:3'-phosphoadenosine 5'-phosphosulfate sulfotransferase
MLELMDLVLIFALNCVITLVLCAVLGTIMYNMRNRDVDRLAEDIYSLRQAIAGRTGLDKKAEKIERENQALTEAGIMLQQGKDIKEVAVAIGAKYPDVALNLAKKFGLGF